MKQYWFFALVVALCITFVSSKHHEKKNESDKNANSKGESTTTTSNNTDSKVFNHETVKRLLEQYKKYDRIKVRSSGGKIDSKKLIEEIRRRRNMPLVNKKIELPTLKLNYTVGDSNWTQKNYSGIHSSNLLLERPILTEGKFTMNDTNNSLLNSGQNSIQPQKMRGHSTTSGIASENDTETSSIQTQRKLQLPKQESSSIAPVTDDEERYVPDDVVDKIGSSQGEAPNTLVSTSTGSSNLISNSSDSVEQTYSSNNQSRLEMGLLNMNTTVSKAPSNQSFDDSEVRVSNKTTISFDSGETTTILKAPLHSQGNSSKTKNNKKPEGKNESNGTTMFSMAFNDSSLNKTELHKHDSLANENNLNADKGHETMKNGTDINDVSKQHSEKVHSGEIKNRFGSFNGGNINNSKIVHRELDQSLLEPAIKVKNSTDLPRYTQQSYREVLPKQDCIICTYVPQKQPKHISFTNSTHKKSENVIKHRGVFNSPQLTSSNVGESLKLSSGQPSKILQEYDAVHTGTPMHLLKPEQMPRFNSDLLQDTLVNKQAFGYLRNLRKPTGITDSLSLNKKEQHMSTGFETNMPKIIEETNTKDVFTGMFNVPYGSTKFPRNTYPIQVVHPSIIFKQPLIQKLYTFYHGHLYLLVPVQRYGHTTVNNHYSRLTDDRDRLHQQDGELSGQDGKPIEQDVTRHPLTNPNLVESNKLDQPDNIAYDGVKDEWQKFHHHDDNRQGSTYILWKQRHTLSDTKSELLPEYSNEIYRAHKTSPLQIDDQSNLPEQSNLIQKPSVYQLTIRNPNGIRPSSVNSIQDQNLYTNGIHPFVSSKNDFTVESNQPYYAYNYPIKRPPSNPNYPNILSKSYDESLIDNDNPKRIPNAVFDPHGELTIANNPTITQIPSTYRTTLEGQLRNKDILSQPWIHENQQTYRNEPMKVSIRGQVPNVYNRFPRLEPNKMNDPETFAQTDYGAERNNLNPASDFPLLSLGEENLQYNQNQPISALTKNPDMSTYNQNTGGESLQGTNANHEINSHEDKAVKDALSSQPHGHDNGNVLGVITSELNEIIDQLSNLEKHPEALFGTDFSNPQYYTRNMKDVQTHGTPDHHFNHVLSKKKQTNSKHLTVENNGLAVGSSENNIGVNSGQPDTFLQPSVNLIFLEEAHPNENPNIENSRRPMHLQQPFEKKIIKEGSQSYENTNNENGKLPNQPFENYNVKEGFLPHENSRNGQRMNQPFEKLRLNDGSQPYETLNIEKNRQLMKIHQPFDHLILNDGSQSNENIIIENSREPTKMHRQFEYNILNQGSQAYENPIIENNGQQIKFHQPFENLYFKEWSKPHQNTKLHNSPRYNHHHEPIDHHRDFSTTPYSNQQNEGHNHQSFAGRYYLPFEEQYHTESGAPYSAADPAQPINRPRINTNNNFAIDTFENTQHQNPFYTVDEENLRSYEIPKFVSPYLNTRPDTRYSFDRSQHSQGTYGYGQTNKMASFPGARYIKGTNDIYSGDTTKPLLENSENNPLNVRSIDWKKYMRPGKKTPNPNRTLDRTFSPVSSNDPKTNQVKDKNDNFNVLLKDPIDNNPPSSLSNTAEPYRPDQNGGGLKNTNEIIHTASAKNQQLLSAEKYQVPNINGVNNNNLYNQQFTGSRNTYNPVDSTNLGSVIQSRSHSDDGKSQDNKKIFRSDDSIKSQNGLYNSDRYPDSSGNYLQGLTNQPLIVSRHNLTSKGSGVGKQHGQSFSYPTYSKLDTQLDQNYYNTPLNTGFQNSNIQPSKLHVPNLPFQENPFNNFRWMNQPTSNSRNDNNRQSISRDNSFMNIIDPSLPHFKFPQSTQNDAFNHFTFTNDPIPKRPFFVHNPHVTRRDNNGFNFPSQTFQSPQPTIHDGNKLSSLITTPDQGHQNQFYKPPILENNNLNSFGAHSFEQFPQIVHGDGLRYHSSLMNTHGASNTAFQESPNTNSINPNVKNQQSLQYSVNPTNYFNAERSPFATNNFKGFETNNPLSVINNDFIGNSAKYQPYSGSNIQHQPIVHHGRSQMNQRFHQMDHLGQSQYKQKIVDHSHTFHQNIPAYEHKVPFSHYHENSNIESMSHMQPDKRYFSANTELHLDEANKNTHYGKTQAFNSLSSDVDHLHSSQGESYNANDKYNTNTNVYSSNQNNVINPVFNSPFPESQPALGSEGNIKKNNFNNEFQLTPSQSNVYPALKPPLAKLRSASGGEGNSMHNNIKNGFQLHHSQSNFNPNLSPPLPDIKPVSGGEGNSMNNNINNGFQLHHNQKNFNPALSPPLPEIKPDSGIEGNSMNINVGYQTNPSQDIVNPAQNSYFHEIQPHSGGRGNNVYDNSNNEFQLHVSSGNGNPGLNSPFPVFKPLLVGDGDSVNHNIKKEVQPKPSHNNVNSGLGSTHSLMKPNFGGEGNINNEIIDGRLSVNSSVQHSRGLQNTNGLAYNMNEISEDLSKIFQKRIARLNKLSEKLKAPIAVNDFSKNRITSRNGALLGLKNKTINPNAENGPTSEEKKLISNEKLNNNQTLKININADSSFVKKEGCLINGTLMDVGEEWTVRGVCGVYTCQSNGVRVLDSKCPKLKIIDGQQCEIENADNNLEFPLCCPSIKCTPKNGSPKNGTGQIGR